MDLFALCSGLPEGGRSCKTTRRWKEYRKRRIIHVASSNPTETANGGTGACQNIIPVTSANPTERKKRRNASWTEYYSCRFVEPNRDSKTEEHALDGVSFLSLRPIQQREQKEGACAGQSIIPVASMNRNAIAKQRTMRWTGYYSFRSFESNRDSKTELRALNRVLFLSLLRTQQRGQNKVICSG